MLLKVWFISIFFLYSSNILHGQNGGAKLGLNLGASVLFNKAGYKNSPGINPRPKGGFCYGVSAAYSYKTQNSFVLEFGLQSTRINYYSKLSDIGNTNLTIKLKNSVRNATFNIGFGKELFKDMLMIININPGIVLPVFYSLSYTEIGLSQNTNLTDTFKYEIFIDQQFNLGFNVSFSLQANYKVSEKISISLTYNHFLNSFPAQKMSILTEQKSIVNKFNYSFSPELGALLFQINYHFRSKKNDNSKNSSSIL